MSTGDAGPVIQVKGLTKTFGGSSALDGVELTIFPGEIHGLLGENGSGKSTLIKVLAGYHAPEGGTLVVNGREVDLPLTPGQPRELGFEFVHQDLGLVPSMSVAENLFLASIAHPQNKLFVSWRRLELQTRAACRRYNLDLDPRMLVEDLRPVERAMLAIVRALEALENAPGRTGATLLVLDEPTVFLPEHEVAVLFDFVREVVRGQSSVLFVSHDLDEVMQITDRITVLRDGKVSGAVTTAETSPHELVELIVGHKVKAIDPVDRQKVQSGALALEARGLTTSALRDVSFDLHAGEVLGLAGLVGSGYEDIVYALFGAIPVEKGQILLEEDEFDASAMTPSRAMARGMALVPGDRQRLGSVPTLSISENMNLLVLERYFRAFVLRQRDLMANARSLMGTFDVRPSDPDLDFGSFSGGNQQKALLAKWLQTDPRILLLHEPTQGVDVGARQQIWAAIRSSTATNSTICASSDYEQLATICDRVAIISRGSLIGILSGADVTKERIVGACLRGSMEDPTVGPSLAELSPTKTSTS